jgi:hypothetical protein
MTIVLDTVHHHEFFQTCFGISCSAANVQVQLGLLEILLDISCIICNFSSGILESKLYCLLGCDII